MSELKFFTVPEIAEILHCHTRSVYRAINGQLDSTPRLKALRYGKRKIITKGSLMQWIDECRGYVALQNHAQKKSKR